MTARKEREESESRTDGGWEREREGGNNRGMLWNFMWRKKGGRQQERKGGCREEGEGVQHKQPHTESLFLLNLHINIQHILERHRKTSKQRGVCECVCVLVYRPQTMCLYV